MTRRTMIFGSNWACSVDHCSGAPFHLASHRTLFFLGRRKFQIFVKTLKKTIDHLLKTCPPRVSQHSSLTSRLLNHWRGLWPNVFTHEWKWQMIITFWREIAKESFSCGSVGASASDVCGAWIEWWWITWPCGKPTASSVFVSEAQLGGDQL